MNTLTFSMRTSDECLLVCHSKIVMIASDDCYDEEGTRKVGRGRMEGKSEQDTNKEDDM